VASAPYDLSDAINYGGPAEDRQAILDKSHHCGERQSHPARNPYAIYLVEIETRRGIVAIGSSESNRMVRENGGLMEDLNRRK
jgi:hypothetical protein